MHARGGVAKRFERLVLPGEDPKLLRYMAIYEMDTDDPEKLVADMMSRADGPQLPVHDSV